MGGTAGQLGRNRDCPAEIGTLDMSVRTLFELRKAHKLMDPPLQ